MTSRRSAGESTVFKGADGLWHGYVSMGTGAGGKRDRRHVKRKTRASAVAGVRELERRRDAGVTVSSGSLTVAGWLGHWLDHVAALRVRPRTLESYRQVVAAHIVPTIGHVRLSKLQPEHVEQLHAAIAAKGLSSATALRAHRVLARALKVAEQRGRVARNVAALVDAPSGGRPASGGALTPEETRKVLSAAQGRRNGARWALALAVGLRQSEVLALRWSDLDLDAGTLTVRRTVHRVTGQGLVFAEPKSERSRRRIALPRPLVDLLRAHRAASWASASGPATAGTTATSSSRRRTAGRWTSAPTGRRGGTCSPRHASARCGCTTPGTPLRRRCWRSACRCGRGHARPLADPGHGGHLPARPTRARSGRG